MPYFLKQPLNPCTKGFDTCTFEEMSLYELILINFKI